jgi:CubicO group peptidase (beta-lactamase class C family)
MRYIVRLSICLIFVVVMYKNVPAQDLQQKINEVMTQYADLDQFSGSVLIAQNGHVLYVNAFGEADKDQHVKNTPNTKYNIGSIGKTFTAISILQLEEQGLLKTTDPVMKHLPDFPFGEKITIHHLLTHTAGTYNYFAHPDFGTQFFKIRSVSDALPLIYEQPLRFSKPGEQFLYSNSGIVILGAVIEKISSKSYPDYIKEHILIPAGMNNTGIHYLEEIVENRAVGYHKSPSGRIQRNIFMVPPANADGGIETTVYDMLAYDQALYSEKLISKESKRKMFTPFLNGYGYCMRIRKEYGNMVVGHKGGAPGVSASFERFLDDKYVIIVLSNYTGGASHVANTLELIIFGKEYREPQRSVTEFLYQYITKEGGDYVLKNAEELLRENGYIVTSSGPLNMLGYELLGDDKTEMAIAVFKINIQLFPDEANPYDSLGDAYLKNGEKEEAKKCFKKAIQIDPNFEASIRKLNEL